MNKRNKRLYTVFMIGGVIVIVLHSIFLIGDNYMDYPREVRIIVNLIRSAWSLVSIILFLIIFRNQKKEK